MPLVSRRPGWFIDRSRRQHMRRDPDQALGSSSPLSDSDSGAIDAAEVFRLVFWKFWFVFAWNSANGGLLAPGQSLPLLPLTASLSDIVVSFNLLRYTAFICFICEKLHSHAAVLAGSINSRSTRQRIFRIST